MSTVTLEEALELFKLPRTLGDLEEHAIVVNTGRFGPYFQDNKNFVSLPKGEAPMGDTLERAIELIQEKRDAEVKAVVKKFDEDPEMEVKNGRFGPYVAYKGVNYKLSKAQAAKAAELTYEECLKHVEAEGDKKKKKK